MVDLKVHRFTDCPSFPSAASLGLRHRLSSSDVRRITCHDCKRRILDAIAARNWAKLVDVEIETLEIAAAECSDSSPSTTAR